jgi:hypothetical protein
MADRCLRLPGGCEQLGTILVLEVVEVPKMAAHGHLLHTEWAVYWSTLVLGPPHVCAGGQLEMIEKSRNIARTRRLAGGTTHSVCFDEM